jgi:hypothetical protein
MSNVEARLASALLLSIAASVGLMAGPSSAARAADSCITEPKTGAPQGKHWYYRIDRGTGRHCWYMRGEDEASARTPAAEGVDSAKAAPQTTGNAAPRSLADAHAEFKPQARVEDTSTPPSRSVWPDPHTAVSAPGVPAPATTGIGPGAGVPATSAQPASPWPQPSVASATANDTPQASPAAAGAPADEASTATPAPSAPRASPHPTREVGSLHELALAALAALALAGISGSLVYRLAGARWRRRRETRWPQRQPVSLSFADETRGAPWVAPELSPTVPHADIADADAAHDMTHEDVAADRIDFGKNDDSFEKIEDFLARLTRQLQDELQTTGATELENPRPR